LLLYKAVQLRPGQLQKVLLLLQQGGSAFAFLQQWNGMQVPQSPDQLRHLPHLRRRRGGGAAPAGEGGVNQGWHILRGNSYPEIA
jgi:hypothetical protein